MAGIAGALFVPIVGIISPHDVGIVPSIGFLIGVASAAGPRCSARCSARSRVAGRSTTLSETIPVGLDLHPGPAVHRGHRVPARRPGVAVAAAAARCAPARSRPRRARPVDRADVTASTASASVRARHDRRRRGMDATTWSSRDLTVDFDGFIAVDGVDLTVLPGDLRFLIGPNGAGKTTLIDADHRAGAGHRVGQVRRARAARPEGAPDRPARRRPHVPDRDGLRGADACCRTSTSPPGAAAAR